MNLVCQKRVNTNLYNALDLQNLSVTLLSKRDHVVKLSKLTKYQCYRLSTEQMAEFYGLWHFMIIALLCDLKGASWWVRPEKFHDWSLYYMSFLSTRSCRTRMLTMSPFWPFCPCGKKTLICHICLLYSHSRYTIILFYVIANDS